MFESYYFDKANKPMPSDRHGTLHQTDDYGDILIEQEMNEINKMENWE